MEGDDTSKRYKLGKDLGERCEEEINEMTVWRKTRNNS